MIDLIERIGPYLGIVAFLGLALLTFLIFQQAREVRRLREWAGRAPERASEAAAASLAAAEARGEAVEAVEEPGPQGRVAERFAGARGRAEAAYATLDRHSPVDPRYLLALLAAAIVAAAVLTSGFGLVGDDDDGRRGGGGGERKAERPPPAPEVAVLNATQTEEGGVEIQGVQGLAGRVATQVVEDAGYEVTVATDATSGVETSVVMYDEVGDEQAAGEFATKIADQLGETAVEPMAQEVRERVDGAPIALLIGQDDADF